MSDEARDETKDKQDERVGRVAWFLTGAAVGLTLAVLYAPTSGRQTRRFLAKKTQRGKDAVTGTSGDIVEAGREMFERGRQLVEDAADLFERGRKLVQG